MALTLNVSSSCAADGGEFTASWTTDRLQTVAVTVESLDAQGTVLAAYASDPIISFQGVFVLQALANGLYRARLDGAADGFIHSPTLGLQCSVDNATPVPVEPATATAPAAKYLAVGGILSNPIEYVIKAGLYDATGNLKANHYVEVNIYREGQTIPFATARQRVRSGQARVDVSQYLMALVDSEPSFLNHTLIAIDRKIMAGFYIGFKEYYGSTVSDEISVPEIKYAVNAANQVLESDFSEYVITAPGTVKKLITQFVDPVKSIGYPFSLGTIIDETLTGTQLYFERRFLDINRQLLETKSTAIPQTYYGKFLRLNVLDNMLACGVFLEATITDTNINTDGVCPDGTVTPDPDPVLENITPEPPAIQADDTADTLAATHPLGTAEILMNVAGAGWVAYAPINIGNANRPKDYVLFKTKAATGRNESEVVGSPAFTAVVVQYTLTIVVNGLARSAYDIFINGTQRIGNEFVFAAGSVLNSIGVSARGYYVTPENYSLTMNENQTLTFSANLLPEVAWGWSASDPLAALQSGNDVIAYQGTAMVYDTDDVEADFHTMPPHQYVVLRVPSTHKVLRSWADTGSTLNYGQIPDSIFRAPFTVGANTYYVSRVPMDFSTAPDARVIFNDDI